MSLSAVVCKINTCIARIKAEEFTKGNAELGFAVCTEEKNKLESSKSKKDLVNNKVYADVCSFCNKYDAEKMAAENKLALWNSLLQSAREEYKKEIQNGKWNLTGSTGNTLNTQA